MRFSQDINIWELAAHKKLEFAEKHHHLGNQQYSEQKYRTSLRSYKRALDAIAYVVWNQSKYQRGFSKS